MCHTNCPCALDAKIESTRSAALNNRAFNLFSPNAYLSIKPLRRLRERLLFILELIERPVDAAHAEELVVCALLADLPFVHDDDLVCALDRRKPVRDDDRGPAFEQRLRGTRDQLLTFSIDGGGGFVQNENA